MRSLRRSVFVDLLRVIVFATAVLVAIEALRHL